ncbi:MAG: hypothetical protein ACLFM1_08565 [Bacteroidales bacterium]
MRTNDSNELFNQSDFERLAKVHEPHCLSIFIPTFRAGQEVKQEHASKTLKNVLKDVRQDLADRNFSENETEAFLRPVVKLVDDKEFWTLQSDGLALFLTDKGMEMFKIPIHFEAYHYLADHHFLKPLIPMLNKDNTFYLLALSIENLKLYECTPHTIAEIDTSDFPQQLEDVVGYDKVPDHLNLRSGQDDQGRAIYHGHGSAKDSRPEEIKKFVREVDKQICTIIGDQSVPLILATDEQLHGVFRQVSKYKSLADTFIPGNPEHDDVVELHQIAYEKLQDKFGKKKKEKINAFLNVSATGKAITDIANIVPASVHGQIDSLFIRRDKDAFGLYDKANNTVIIDEEKMPQNASLYNLAAINTILNSGNVYVMDAEEMPLKNTNANALLRY